MTAMEGSCCIRGLRQFKRFAKQCGRRAYLAASSSASAALAPSIGSGTLSPFETVFQ
jgi:hypothetical protein